MLSKYIYPDQPDPESGCEVLKLCSCSTQLGMISLHGENQDFVSDTVLILLVNIEIPAKDIVALVSFVSMMNFMLI